MKSTKPIDNGDEALMTSHEVAAMLSVELSTLAFWRCKGGGPAYVKMTPGLYGRVRYRRSDVIAFINTRDRIQPVSQVA